MDLLTYLKNYEPYELVHFSGNTYCRRECFRLLLDGKLDGYLHEVDEECHARVELLVEQMKAGVGITEKLKATNQMKWVGFMNNVRITAEEIVKKEMIYV